MPLQDHFHPPLSVRRRWTSFHGGWAMTLATEINRLLPAGYFAEPLCMFVTEIDVATFDNADGNGVCDWIPTPPTRSLLIAAATDTAEVRVYRIEEGPELAGCIELVSPSKKDRPAEREAFVSKCAAYLHDGVGLIMVDVVTDRTADLHAALLTSLADDAERAEPGRLRAVAYRPRKGHTATRLDVWEAPLAVGGELPTLPLWLGPALSVPVDLEATYRRTCEDLRLPVAS